MAVISRDLGPVTAYAAAVNRGYTGTREEFETLMASYATVAEQAGESAESAEESADSAAQSAASASQSAQNAESSKYNALLYSNQANGYKNTANTAAQAAKDARDAAQSAQTAAEAAQEGAEAAVDGFDSAVTQAISDVNAAGTNQKELAKRQAEKSEAWAVGQISGEDVGVSDPAYHNNAKYYAESAGTSATTATTKASEAAASASAAAASAQTLVIDDTLTEEGQAADAKAVGDKIEGVKADLADVLDLQSSSSVRKPINWANGYLNGTTGVFGNDTKRLRSGFLSGDGKDYTVTVADGFVLERIGEYSAALQNSFVQFLTDGLETLTSIDVTLSQGKYYVFQIRKEPIAAISASDVDTSTVVLTNYEIYSERLNTIETTLSNAVSDIESVTSDVSFVKDVIGYKDINTWDTGYIQTVAVGQTASLTRTTFGTLSFIIADCVKGQHFVINGTPRDSSGTRPYMFVDKNNVCKYRSDETAEMVNYETVAPCDGKLVVNLLNANSHRVRSGYADISTNVSNLEDIVGTAPIKFTDGYYIATKTAGQTLDSLTPQSSTLTKYALMDCYAKERIVISGTPTSNSGRALYMFVDSNLKVLERGPADGIAVEDMVLTAPADCKLAINFLLENPCSGTIQFMNMGKAVSENEVVSADYKSFKNQPLTKLPDYILNNMAFKPLGALDKGYMVLVTDDGREDGSLGICSFTIPLAIEKDVPFTFSLMSTSDVFTNQTWTDILLDAITNHACSVAQHGVRRFSTYGEQELVQFFDSEKAFFDSKGIELHGAVCPAHCINKMVMAVAGGRFGVVRSGYFGGTAEDKAQYNGIDLSNFYDYYTSGANSNKYGLSCFNISAKSLDYSKSAIDYAYANNKILIALYHEFSSDLPDASAKQKIADVIDYAKAKGMTFITLGDIEKLPFASRSTL